MAYPIPQKDRPVGLVVIDLLGLPIPWTYLFYPRPEDLQYTHPSRGTVIQTFDGGFVDDFGEGLTDIIATGNTGWSGGMIPGELKWYILRDMVVIRYHEMRKAKADAGLPIDSVKMYWVDTLNMLVYEVYPISFVARKNKQRPLLYQFTLRMTGINRLFSPGMLLGALTGAIGGLFG
jgi:hypothetical protein